MNQYNLLVSDVLLQPTLSDEPVQPMSVAELAPLTFLDEPVQPTRLRCSGHNLCLVR